MRQLSPITFLQGGQKLEKLPGDGLFEFGLGWVEFRLAQQLPGQFPDPQDLLQGSYGPRQGRRLRAWASPSGAGPQSGDGGRTGGFQVAAGQELLEILPSVGVSAGVAVRGVPQQAQERVRISQPQPSGRLNDVRGNICPCPPEAPS